MIKENQKALNVLLLFVDALICCISMLLAYFLRFDILTGLPSAIDLPFYLQMLVIVVPVYFFIYHYFTLHDAFRYKSLVLELGKVIQANIFGVFFIFIMAFILKHVDISRLTIALFGIINTALTGLERIMLRKLLRWMRRKGYNLKHLLIVGWNDVSGEFCRKVLENKSFGYWIDGYLSGGEDPKEGGGLPYLGDFSSLEALLQGGSIDEVLISLDYDEFPLLPGLIEVCERQGVKSSLLPFYTRYLPTKPYVDEIEGIPLINLRHIPLDNAFNAVAKRAFDFTASLFGLLLLSPFLLCVAIGVKLSSPGPIIYRQTRIGRNKKEFTMYKFRSMAVEGNQDATTWGTKNDQRRTGFGAFIRKFSIDELPQLVNVLKGDMSLVGPRPERPFFVEKFRDEVPLYMLKHLVRPGITGWAQINGWRGDTSIVERIKCDLFYIENWSFLLDIKILFMTVFKGFINSAEEL